VLLFVKVADVHKFKQEGVTNIKHAAYGLEFWERAVPIHKRTIGEAVNWAEFAKSGEGEEKIANQEAVMVAYLLRRRPVP
jgi:hypothetical protein